MAQRTEPEQPVNRFDRFAERIEEREGGDDELREKVESLRESIELERRT